VIKIARNISADAYLISSHARCEGGLHHGGSRVRRGLCSVKSRVSQWRRSGCVRKWKVRRDRMEDKRGAFFKRDVSRFERCFGFALCCKRGKW